MRTLNLGILAHVDAGKTSLTERLLHAAGVIDEIGSVDDGSTQTDSLELERARGITIKAAVVSFRSEDVTVNLIDTPGHPDFIAEVERALSVLDGAVLVISGVEGVQAQTRLLMRTLKRLGIPTLIFVNKLDLRGADDERTLRDIAEKLTDAAVPMGAVRGLGTADVEFSPFPAEDAAFLDVLAEVLTAHDEALLGEYVRDPSRLTSRRLRETLRRCTAAVAVHPVYLGSAITGTGIDELRQGITELLPSFEGDPETPVYGRVFKVERGPAGEKVAYAALGAGTVRLRDEVAFGRGRRAKVTAITAFEDGASPRASSLVAGQIGRIWGLAEVQIGDGLGDGRADDRRYFAPPTLETVVAPRNEADRGALYAALTQMEEQDPLIALRQDDTRREIFVSLYGEVQKEVIEATLASEYGLAVEFREMTTLCVERPAGTGAAVEAIRQPGNPFLATVGLRVEPAPEGSAASYHVDQAVHGTMPAAFFRAIEDTVFETLQQGLHGWPVRECRVTLTHTGYQPRQSHAHQRFSKSMSSTGEDFRKLTPLVLMSALAQAGATVLEPVHRFHLDVPEGDVTAVLQAVATGRGVPLSQTPRGAFVALEGTIPAAEVGALQRLLPALTSGEGALDTEFEGYAPAPEPAPERPRTDHNPLNRKEYLLHVVRRV